MTSAHSTVQRFIPLTNVIFAINHSKKAVTSSETESIWRLVWKYIDLV